MYHLKQRDYRMQAGILVQLCKETPAGNGVEGVFQVQAEEAAIGNSLYADMSGMTGSLDTSFGENRSLYMAQVVDRNNRYPSNGLTVS
jgi:hypothetical protein